MNPWICPLYALHRWRGGDADPQGNPIQECRCGARERKIGRYWRRY